MGKRKNKNRAMDPGLTNNTDSQGNKETSEKMTLAVEKLNSLLEKATTDGKPEEISKLTSQPHLPSPMNDWSRPIDMSQGRQMNSMMTNNDLTTTNALLLEKISQISEDCRQMREEHRKTIEDSKDQIRLIKRELLEENLKQLQFSGQKSEAIQDKEDTKLLEKISQISEDCHQMKEEHRKSIEESRNQIRQIKQETQELLEDKMKQFQFLGQKPEAIQDKEDTKLLEKISQISEDCHQMKEEHRKIIEESKDQVRIIKQETQELLEEKVKQLQVLGQKPEAIQDKEDTKEQEINHADKKHPMNANQMFAPYSHGSGKCESFAPCGTVEHTSPPQRNQHTYDMAQHVHEMLGQTDFILKQWPPSPINAQKLSRLLNIDGKIMHYINNGPFATNSEEDPISFLERSNQFLQDLLRYLEERREILSFIQEGVIYFQEGCNVSNESRKMFDKVLYVFYFSCSKMAQNEQLWNFLQQLMQFQRSKENREEVALALYDLERDENPKICKDVIQVFQNGELVCNDLLLGVSQFEKICSAYPVVQYEQRPIPDKKVNFEVACPLCKKNGKCPSKDVAWLCIYCQQSLVYGFDFYLYCNCGAAKVETFMFKCDSKCHGKEYVFHEKKDIPSLLNNMKSFDGLTILILGETGAGKSTFINGFANYMQYPTLEKAKESEELLSPVKSTFMMANEDFEEVCISTGEDKNECQKVGQSATQGTKAHVFNYKGSVNVRLIDTPGIGDTRGIEQDKENFMNILGHISYYDEIHGICILLKPNDSRLTVMFEFCVKELLIHLHKDVARNIVFCFTHARNTNYRPGDTFSALKALLKQSGHKTDLVLSKQNVFCMDNESFRYLAAYKMGINFTEEEDKIYSASWKKSTSETNRMMSYISSLEPHKVKDTLSVNDVRRKILDMTKPLAEIAKQIDTTVLSLEDQKSDIENSELEASQMWAKINIQIPSLERRTLEYPRTVCTSLDCHEVHTVDGQKVKKFSTHCHERCYLDGVQTDVTNNPDLKYCHAMSDSGGMHCYRCGCSWNTHMHVTYEMVSIMKGGEDKSAKQTYQGITNRLKLKEVAKADFERIIKELQDEKDEIIQAAAQFGLFIKENSFLPYNDAMISYLNFLIKREEGKVHLGEEDSTKLDTMLQLKLQYEEEVQLIKDATLRGVAFGGALIENQNEIMARLFSLKHYGQNMRNILTELEESKISQIAFSEERYESKPGILNQMGGKFSSFVGSFFKFTCTSEFIPPIFSSRHQRSQFRKIDESCKGNDGKHIHGNFEDYSMGSGNQKRFNHPHNQSFY